MTNASSPVVISSSIGNVLTYTLTSLPTAGSHTYGLLVSGRDQSGNSKSSVPATATVVVGGANLNPPIGSVVAPRQSIRSLAAWGRAATQGPRFPGETCAVEAPKMPLGSLLSYRKHRASGCTRPHSRGIYAANFIGLIPAYHRRSGVVPLTCPVSLIQS